MRKPMLAAPMKKGVITNWSDWAIEEKYDGHRLIVRVQEHAPLVTAWARPRGDGRQVERSMPVHLIIQLSQLPVGIYDGELLGGDVSTDVSRLDLKHELRYVVFDVLVREGVAMTGRGYDVRRAQLERDFARLRIATHLTLAESCHVNQEKDVTRFVERVWKRGGEGAILKQRTSAYYEGQRAGAKRCPLVWIKIKRVEHDTLTVVGFEPTKGSVMNRGPFAIVRLRDDEGNETTCKTLNDDELRRFEKEWEPVAANIEGTLDHTLRCINVQHPAIGRKLVVEHFGRTRDGGYRGPVTWDRWENE